MVGCLVFRPGSLLETWLGLESLAQDHSFYHTKYQPRRPHQTSIYEAFPKLSSRKFILILHFGESMSRSAQMHRSFSARLCSGRIYPPGDIVLCCIF